MMTLEFALFSYRRKKCGAIKTFKYADLGCPAAAISHHISCNVGGGSYGLGLSPLSQRCGEHISFSRIYMVLSDNLTVYNLDFKTVSA